MHGAWSTCTKCERPLSHGLRFTAKDVVHVLRGLTAGELKTESRTRRRGNFPRASVEAGSVMVLRRQIPSVPGRVREDILWSLFFVSNALQPGSEMVRLPG